MCCALPGSHLRRVRADGPFSSSPLSHLFRVTQRSPWRQGLIDACGQTARHATSTSAAMLRGQAGQHQIHRALSAGRIVVLPLQRPGALAAPTDGVHELLDQVPVCGEVAASDDDPHQLIAPSGMPGIDRSGGCRRCGGCHESRAGQARLCSLEWPIGAAQSGVKGHTDAVRRDADNVNSWASFRAI